MNSQSLKNFIFTVSEYKRFADYFKTDSGHHLLDDYSSEDYIAIQTKLLLLRKYGSKGQKNTVFLRNVLECAKEEFKEKSREFELLIDKFERVQKNEIETILSDGKSSNLYETIENVMYGLYLHADTKRIEDLLKIDRNLLFVATRKYVEELEEVVLESYDLLFDLVDYKYEQQEYKKAPILAINDKQQDVSAGHNIKGSPFWSNLYGKDASQEDFNTIIGTNSLEDNLILIKGIVFLEEGIKDDYNKGFLAKMVFPYTTKDWGDFSSLNSFLKELGPLGCSSRVRYNDRHDMAYMNIYQNVDGAFVIDTPQIFYGNAKVLTFVKDKKGDWKVYCFGDKLDDYKETVSLKEWIKRLLHIRPI